MHPTTLTLNHSIGHTLDALTQTEFLSIPFLPEHIRSDLLGAARKASYRTLPAIAHASRVMQTLDLCEIRLDHGYLGHMSSHIKHVVETHFAAVEPYLFTEPLNLNEVSLLRYQPGGGNSPHVEGKRFSGIVALIIIDGYGELYHCTDRSGSNSTNIPCPPGQLIMMPAGGYMDRVDTPFHFVENVTTERYVLGLRHNTKL